MSTRVGFRSHDLSLRAQISRLHDLISDARQLVMRTAMLAGDMQTVMVCSANAIRQSRYLAPLAIRGGADDAGALITALTSYKRICLDCCAAKAGMSPASVSGYLEELGKTVIVQDLATDACGACGTIGPTYSVL